MAASTPPAGEITELIVRANDGDAGAVDALFAALYADLHGLARAKLRHNAPFTVLDTTALLHESYLRLVNTGALNVANRAHFMAYAARTMRSIIVDFARQRLADRRGGGAAHVPLDTDIAQSVAGGEDEIVRVHEALADLAQADERLARVVEMRYFAGLTEQEIATALGVTDRTVRRDWDKARLLLSLALR